MYVCTFFSVTPIRRVHSMHLPSHLRSSASAPFHLLPIFFILTNVMWFVYHLCHIKDAQLDFNKIAETLVLNEKFEFVIKV